MSPCWAPRWVGSIGDEYSTIIMASQKKAKRVLSDSDSESEYSIPSTTFARFLVIESADSSKPVTKLSPFIIEKSISAILGTPKSVKKLKNETLLVECFSQQQVKNLLGHKKLFNLDVNIFPHKTLNTSKGVIRCKELSFCDSLEEIKSNLKSQAVSDVKRISVLRNGIRRDTHTYILTFSTPILPTSIKVGFQSVKVDVYVPNPLRCYRCQRYGHHESNCRSTPVCPKCAFEGEDHDQKTCNDPPLCVNCKSSHPTYSKECSVWKDEKEILSIKFKDNVTFLEARKTVEKRRSDQAMLSKSTTYANVVSPLPTNGHCPTCELLAKKLLQKFPEMTDELKALIPNVQVTKPSTQTQLASETNKPSSAPSKPTNSQSIALQKTSNPSTSLQNNPLKKGSKPSPASKPSPPSQQPPKKPQPSSSQFTTRSNVSPKENKSNDPPRPKKRSTSKPKPQSRDNPESCEITVKEDDPVPTSNRFSELEDMDADVENLEGEVSDSEASIWSISKDPWNKDTENWHLSKAETSVMKS